MVGMSGASGVRVRLVMASARTLPSRICGSRIEIASKVQCTCWPSSGGERLAAALVGHADEIGAGARLEQLGGQMRQAARAGVREVELARIGLRVGDEFLHALPRRGGMHHEDLVALGNLRDRREALRRIVAGARRHRRDHGEHAGVADQQRQAVGRRGRDRARADRAARAGTVLHDRRLAELRQDLREEPRRNVGRPARRRGHDQPDRLVGKGLREGRAAERASR